MDISYIFYFAAKIRISRQTAKYFHENIHHTINYYECLRTSVICFVKSNILDRAKSAKAATLACRCLQFLK